jgi:WbqC-like protein family
MAICIAGSQYIPSIEYFAHWKYHGHITLEAHEHYQKRTWRNKTAILGPDAPQFLTVPLQKGKHQQMAIRDVRIAYDEPWRKIHLNSLKTVYGKTAFFDEVLPGLEQLYQAEFETLWELNIAGLKIILSLLGSEFSYNLSEIFSFSYPPDVADLRLGVPAGVATLPAPMIPVYPQVQRLDKTHQPNLCILDALCHIGPQTRSYLDRYAYKLYEKP